jgi:hypothetical protein
MSPMLLVNDKGNNRDIGNGTHRTLLPHQNSGNNAGCLDH